MRRHEFLIHTKVATRFAFKFRIKFGYANGALRIDRKRLEKKEI